MNSPWSRVAVTIETRAVAANSWLGAVPKKPLPEDPLCPPSRLEAPLVAEARGEYACADQ